MDNKKKKSGIQIFFDCAQLVIALFIPLAIIAYTVMQNNTEISIAQENRKQDLKIADERHEQEIILSTDEQEEAALVRYFDSLGKLLEKDMKLMNRTSIARFKTLTALAQLKSKRKGYLIRALIENKLITMNYGEDLIIDLSLADLTGLDLSTNMLVKKEITCANFNQTTLINASFRGVTLTGITFAQSILINSDFSLSSANMYSCGDSTSFRTNFMDTILDNSTFDGAKHIKSSFDKSSLNHVRMRRFKCTDCIFTKAKMYSADLSDATFQSELGSRSRFYYQKMRIFSTLLYRAKFFNINFAQTELTMVNATMATFNNCDFSVTVFKNNSFIQTTIYNSPFFRASLKQSSWYKAKISYTSFFETDMTDINFIDSECHYCHFNQTLLKGANFTNSSLDGSDFSQANITYQELIVARSLQNVILPNGTIFQ
ncbi:unnamed protein product [Adineta steineri]|uniref:Pentapeptide repeat-containing protein n=1 Tax=Adineta steineri TaxID=433720 RepID=A0A815PP06_9BILA|nr:unnamed protein product [Adineta steineri]CAF1630974.1 unnamed protein product [Adineta steineri]